MLASSSPRVSVSHTQSQGARRRVVVAARRDTLACTLASGIAALTLATAPLAHANVRLPPLSTDPDRCDRAFVGNTIGQANAVSDRIVDLRFCKLAKANLQEKTLSGALMSEADFSGAQLQQAVLTKVYAVKVNMEGADLTNSVIDRAAFDGANLKGAKMVNAVITGSTFDGADLTDVDFEDALIGNEDAKRLCGNPTLVGESRAQVGCRGK